MSNRIQIYAGGPSYSRALCNWEVVYWASWLYHHRNEINKISSDRRYLASLQATCRSIAWLQTFQVNDLCRSETRFITFRKPFHNIHNCQKRHNHVAKLFTSCWSTLYSTVSKAGKGNSCLKPTLIQKPEWHSSYIGFSISEVLVCLHPANILLLRIIESLLPVHDTLALEPWKLCLLCCKKSSAATNHK